MKTAKMNSRKRPSRIDGDASPSKRKRTEKPTPTSISQDELRMAKTQKVSHPPPRQNPLNGMVISISTLASNNANSDHDSSSTSYNQMVKLCNDLGATVSSQVCKRMHVLVCTKSAVDKSTQRVRKAMKKKKPVVSIAWIEACRSEGRKVDYERFRLDGEGEDAIKRNLDRLLAEGRRTSCDKEVLQDLGWTEPVDLG